MPADNLTPTWNPDVTPDIVANNFTLEQVAIETFAPTIKATRAICKHCNLRFRAEDHKASDLMRHVATRHPDVVKSYVQI